MRMRPLEVKGCNLQHKPTWNMKTYIADKSRYRCFNNLLERRVKCLIQIQKHNQNACLMDRCSLVELSLQEEVIILSTVFP